MSLSLQIRSLRLAEGLTQTDLAARVGIAQPNLAAFESGARRPSLYTLGLLAEGLGVDPSRLLQGPSVVLDRFQMDRVTKALVSASPKPDRLPAPLWKDLQVLFFSKLKAVAPDKRRLRLRISPYAAERRVKAWIGSRALDELIRRFEKIYP
jgi:transcriptional regulator with XRE-family HTH domain